MVAGFPNPATWGALFLGRVADPQSATQPVPDRATRHSAGGDAQAEAGVVRGVRVVQPSSLGFGLEVLEGGGEEIPNEKLGPEGQYNDAYFRAEVSGTLSLAPFTCFDVELHFSSCAHTH